jgi:ABC-type uncharacterized transport system permease subunit
LLSRSASRLTSRKPGTSNISVGPSTSMGQGLGLALPSQFLSMLPYLATIVILVIICRNPQTILLNKPMSLGQNFRAD